MRLQIILSTTYPVIGDAAESVGVNIELISLIREGREKVRKMTPNTLEGGKVQQIIISKELAEKGINNLLEIYLREPSNPALAFVVVTEGLPSKLFEAGIKFKDKPRIAFYIHQLLEHNITSSSAPDTKVYDFELNYFAPGLDPITPMIRLSGNDVQLIGTALFCDDRMVGQINTQQTALLLAMMGQMQSTEFIFSYLEKDTYDKHGLALLLDNPKRKIQIGFDEDMPVLHINLDFTAILDEYSWTPTNKLDIENKIEQQAKKHLEADCTELLKYMQMVGCDSIGIGDMIRAKYNDYWKSLENWKDIYKDINFTIDANVEIIYHGIIN